MHVILRETVTSLLHGPPTAARTSRCKTEMNLFKRAEELLMKLLCDTMTYFTYNLKTEKKRATWNEVGVGRESIESNCIESPSEQSGAERRRLVNCELIVSSRVRRTTTTHHEKSQTKDLQAVEPTPTAENITYKFMNCDPVHIINKQQQYSAKKNWSSDSGFQPSTSSET
jgi:hypothetical protein